jgi:formate dehydrogenase major subunit
MKLTIDGRPFETDRDITILEACESIGIEIPTLCNDPRLIPFTSCFLCVVEVEGAKGSVPACATKVREGMVVKTNTQNINETRRLCMELLLSDHAGDCIAPCRFNCPAGIDIQSYVAHVANRDYKSAIKTIKDTNPLPLVCGRVCPKPCEDVCRRGLMEGPVAIDNIKRFVSDEDLKEPFIPEVKPATGKRIAIVGAGPAGLSCAYYLKIEGYDVEIFEKSDRPGGMLLWGIPEYRLPKSLLAKEIEIITRMGVKIHFNKTLGKDFSIKDLKERYDAVFLAIGAQKSTAMRVKNEDAKGVFGGIDFLYTVAKGNKIDIGKGVVVVGGGNTAIDAARTAVRLGAGNVTIVYRRTRDEMPAEDIEIEEAGHEGAIFKFLRAPTEILTQDGKVTGIKCQVMGLGEADSSGRRRPVPVDGEFETIEADTIIAAIGQYVDPSGLDVPVDGTNGISLTKYNTISANVDERTFQTNIPGIFAGGDAVTGPSIAISAIAHGRYGAASIHSWLSGQPLVKDFRSAFNFSLGQNLTEVDKNYIPHAPKQEREKSGSLPIKERLDNFNEVDFTYSEEQAVREAKRCLSCGCLDADECKLRLYAERFKINVNRIRGGIREQHIDSSSKYLVFDSTKCIKCGKCIRVCSDLKAIGALGFAGRGFETDMLPSMEKSLIETSCIECGSCESVCPSGAILDKSLVLEKIAQFKTEVKPSICRECSIGCEIFTVLYEDKIIRVIPKNRGTVYESMLCKTGRYESMMDIEKSQAFDFSQYEKMKLYDASIRDIKTAISSSEVIINWGVDIFNFYAPVSYHLKKYLDKNSDAALSTYFYFKTDFDIFGFNNYPINRVKSQSETIMDKGLLQVIESGKRILIILEETSLSKTEIEYFMNLKEKGNIKILNLVRRKNF